jgi:hypothetical protein
MYIGRKWNQKYAHTHREVLSRYGSKIVHHEDISGIFSGALGNYGYVTRSPNLEELKEIAAYVQEKAGSK